MELTLTARPRTVTGKQNKRLRQNGFLPAVLYGRGKESLSLEVSTREFEKVFKRAGESALINLQIAGSTDRKVLVHDVARHFMKSDPIHIDFYEVDLTRKIHAKIPLHFVGAAPAVKELGGILIKSLSEVEVEALPQDLPQFIEVNMESLKQFEDLVRVADVKVSGTVKIINHLEDVMVSVQAPRSEAELAELEKPAAEAEKAAIESMTKEQEVEKAEKTEVPAKEGEKAEALGSEKSEKKE